MKAYQFQHETTTNARSFGRKDDIEVTFEGDVPFVKGKRINLPSLSLDHDLSSRQVNVLRGYVDQEAGRIRHTDTKRVSDFESRCENNKREALAKINSTLMDQWVGHKVRGEYAGAHKHLEESHRLSMSLQGEALKEVPDGTFGEFSPDILPTLIQAGQEAYKNPTSLDSKVTRVFSEELQEHAAKWREELTKCESTEDVITLSKSIWKLINEEGSEESSPDDFDPKDGEGMDEGEPGEDQQEGEGDAKDGKGKEGDAVKEAQAKAGKQEDALTSEHAELDASPTGAIGGMDGPLRGGYRVYTTAGDVVYRRRGCTSTSEGSVNRGIRDVVESTDHALYFEVKNRIKSSTMVMKAKLRRALMAKQNRSWDKGKEQGHLDATRLVKAQQRHSQVFKVREEVEEHDTAICVLVDLSGSMGGRKSEVARDVSVALAECFEGTQLKYKIVGFHNRSTARVAQEARGTKGQYHRYESTHTVVFKDFGDTLRRTQGSVASLPDAVGGNNSDYDFVAAELAELETRDESRKVLFVLSDGRPACHSDAATSEHIRHIKKTIKDHSRKGVECVGIGICDSAVKEIYPKNVVVDNVEELATKVFGTLTSILVK